MCGRDDRLTEKFRMEIGARFRLLHLCVNGIGFGTFVLPKRRPKPMLIWIRHDFHRSFRSKPDNYASGGQDLMFACEQAGDQLRRTGVEVAYLST